MYVRILTTAPSPHLPVFNGQTVFGVNPPTQSQTVHSLQWAFGVQSQPSSMLTFLYLELYSISLEYSASPPPPPKMVITFLQQVLWNVGSPPHPTTISSVSTPPPPQPTHIHTHTSSLFASLLLFSGHFMVLGNCNGVQLPHSKSNVLAVVRTRTQNVEDCVLKVCQHNVALQVGENSC